LKGRIKQAYLLAIDFLPAGPVRKPAAEVTENRRTGHALTTQRATGRFNETPLAHPLAGGRGRGAVSVGALGVASLPEAALPFWYAPGVERGVDR